MRICKDVFLKPVVNRLSIVHVVGSLRRDWGGLSLFVARLAAYQSSAGHRVSVLCAAGGEETWDSGDAEVSHAAPGSAHWRDAIAAGDIVHVHGLWLWQYHRALAEARRSGKPHMLSIHGMLEPAAVRFSRWKKRLAFVAYQNADLHSAPVLHATAGPELATIRSKGLSQPVVVIPPGVDVPAISNSPSISRRTALFIGRIHPQKGLLELIQAWAMTRPLAWRLVIAGPDQSGHRTRVEHAAEQLGIAEQIVWHGAVFGQEKSRLLFDADLVVAPSHSENFGIVVAEALVHGKPVIATHGMPWECLETESCGWWVRSDPESLASALKGATNLPREVLSEMGERGRTLATRNFSWEHVARDFLDSYAWMRAEADRPSNLDTIKSGERMNRFS